MIEFNKQYLYVEWNDALEGRDVLVSDYIPDLKAVLSMGKVEFVRIVKSKSEYFPFSAPNTASHAQQNCRFCYYDPYLKYKLALKEGKVVQYNDNGIWRNVCWGFRWGEDFEYHIVEEEMKSKRLTHRQLSQWLAQGNGQYKYRDGTLALCNFVYREHIQDEFVGDTILVRKWEDTEWYEPTVDYCFPGR